MSVTIEVEGRQELIRALRKAKDRGMKSLAAGLFGEGNAVMRESKREVPVDEGTLRASGFVDLPKIDRAGIEVVLGYGGAASSYAVFVHEGTGPAVGRPPYFPPIDVIGEWVRRVLGVTDEGAVFMIARAIGQRGLPPKKFLERPLKARASGMSRRLARRVRRDIERVV